MLFVYAGMLLLFFLQGSHFLQKNKGRGYCVLAAVFLAGISAMKKITANGDLLGYLARYQTLSVQSYRFLWEAWQNGAMKDFGFYAAGKAFADFGLGAEVWMGAIAVFFAACFGWFIYRHSQQRFLSVLILLTLYFNFTLSGLRQTMAMAVIFAAFHFITEEQPDSAEKVVHHAERRAKQTGGQKQHCLSSDHFFRPLPKKARGWSS